MVAGKDQPYAAGGASTALLLHGAALAAGLLENACAPGAGDPLRLDVVRTLARDLKGELEALAALASGGTARIEVVEGALRAADVANLAACAVPELPETRVSEAVAAAHLAAGATRVLGALVYVDDGTGYQEPYSLKDARGAAWRARLTVRQVDEFLGENG